jgi:hypothetical protein
MMVWRALPALVLAGLSLRAQLVAVGIILAVLVAYVWTIGDSKRSGRLVKLIAAMRGDRSPPGRGRRSPPTPRNKG